MTKKKLTIFAIKNFVMAIGLEVIGVLMGISASFVITIIGISIVWSGLCSFSETSVGVSIAVIIFGIALIAVGESLLKDYDKISSYISAVCIGIVAGYEYYFKVYKSAGSEKWQKLLTKLLFLIYPALLIAGAIVAVFLQNLALSSTLFTLGTVGWIVHTILIIYLKKPYLTSGSSSGSGKSNSGRSYSSSSSSVNCAGEGKVADEMRSLANYFTGGFDTLGNNVTIKYSVSVSVSNGEIKFVVSGQLSGTNNITNETQASNVKHALESSLKKRTQLVLDRADKRLTDLKPDRDYTINVSVGSVS